MILYRVTCKDMKEAKKIATELIKLRLVACANMYPCETVYEWDGELVEEKEAILVLKTNEAREEQVKQKVRMLHSYDLPAIIRISARGNEEFVEWLESQMKQKAL